MKKTLILLAGLLLCLYARAYTCVTFNSGDPSVLTQKATITYAIDWDHARVVNFDNLLFPQYLQKRGADFVADWPKDRQKAEKYFTSRFNQKSDYLKIDKSNANGEYKLTMRIATIDVGNGAGVFNPWASSKAGGVIINGTIEFSNRQGQVVCILNIVEGKGSASPSETTRIGLALTEIAGDIHDFIEDNVEKGKVKATPVAGAVAAATATAATAVSSSSAVATTPAATTTTTKPDATTKAAATTKRKAAQSNATASTAPATTAATASTAAATTSLGEARVTLKNGSVIIGKVKAFDPTQSITLFVAGLTTTIPMAEVQNVESVNGGSLSAASGGNDGTLAVSAAGATASSPTAVAMGGESLGSRKLLVTDGASYSEAITLTVGGQTLRLVLVRGGRMNMGYDGSGSVKMMSEPIHEVVLTSYYISDQPIPTTVASQFIKNVEGRGNEPAQFRDYSEAQQLVGAIARQTGQAFRLPTEAEWEYAASGDMQNQVFALGGSRYVYYEWTSDYHDEFSDDRSVLTDPTGPFSGKEHQVRSFNGKRGKYDRSNKVNEDDAYVGLVRLVIKARDVK